MKFKTKLIGVVVVLLIAILAMNSVKAVSPYYEISKVEVEDYDSKCIKYCSTR